MSPFLLADDQSKPLTIHRFSRLNPNFGADQLSPN